MPKLTDLVKELEKTNPRNTSNIAGYISAGTFFYQVSKNENLPAAASLFDTMASTDPVYTNLKKEHWLYTWTSGGKRGRMFYVHDQPIEANDAKALGGTLKYKVVAGNGTDPGPVGGGLFQAAKTLRDTPVFYKASTDTASLHTKEKGLHRVLRYYMLAAYSVLGKCSSLSYKSGNYIAALMVNDSGRILSYGINSGWFHHGEVNMLLNYFVAHAAANKFPENTLIFSTLTPCLQCSTYLQESRSAESIIFIGQEDTGPKGAEGAKYGTFLRNITDPVRSTLQEEDKKVKVGVDVKLTSTMTKGGTIASQIGSKGALVLSASLNTLLYKSVKDRKERDDAPDIAVKKAALAYLISFVNGVTADVKEIG